MLAVRAKAIPGGLRLHLDPNNKYSGDPSWTYAFACCDLTKSTNAKPLQCPMGDLMICTEDTTP